MIGLVIFKLLFGNVINFSKSVNDLTSSKAVNQLNDVFYNSFQKILKGQKKSVAISQLLRLERKKLISFFEVEIQKSATFNELFSDDILSRLSDVLYKLLEDETYKDHLDLEGSKKIISETLKVFRQEIYNQISEKQGIYLILKSIPHQEELLNQIINRVSISEDKIIKAIENVGKDSESIIRDDIKDAEDRIVETISTRHNQQLEQFSLKREKDIALEAIEPIIKDIYKEACDLANNYDYTTAIKKFRKAIKLYKKYESQKDQTFYNIYTNIAFCYERQEKHKKASKLFVKALKYNKDDPKAIYQAYLGHDSLGNDTTKSKLKDKLFTDHKNSSEYIMLPLFLSKTDDTIDVQLLEKKSIENFSDDLEIQYAIAKAYLAKNNLGKYREYMYKAIKLAPDSGALLLKPLLAFHLSHPYTSTFQSQNTKTFTAEVKKDLNEAIKLYKESWEYLKEKPNNKIFANRPVNISTVYASLQNYEQAIKWIDLAISVCKYDYFIGHKVMYLRNIGKDKEAIEEASKIKDIFGSQMDGTFITYLELLFNDTPENKIRAISLAYEFLDKKVDSQNYNDIIYFLSIMLVAEKRIDEAFSFLNKQLEKDSQNKKLPIALSKAYFANGDKEQAYVASEQALKSVKNIKPESADGINFLCELGCHLFDIEKYQDAASILERVNLSNMGDYLNGMLFDCYIQINQLEKALNLFKEIRVSKGIHLTFTLKEISILIQNRDYRTAVAITEDYNRQFPNSIEGRIALCNLYLILKDIKKASTVDLNFPLEELSLQQISYLLRFLHTLKRRNKIFKLIYELWKTRKSAEVCNFILMAGTSLQVTKEELEIEGIKPPCVVFLKDEDSDSIEEYVLLEDESVDYDRHKEINSRNPLFNMLIGKKRGEKIIVKQGLGYNSEMEIIDIRTIYQYAFIKATEAIATQYKGQTPTIAMNPKDAETGVKQIFKIIDQLSKSEGISHTERCRYKNENIEKYCKFEVPFGSMKNLLSFPLIPLWYHFSENPDIGIRSIGGSLQEMKNEQEVLSDLKKGRFCIDLTSLLTLFHTGVADSIVEVTGKFHIAQSTVDLIEQTLIDRDSVIHRSNWGVIIYENDGKSIRYRTSQERYTQLWHDLEKISQWIKDYCELPEPAKSRLSISKEEQERMSFLLGDTCYDTILLAKENESVLIVDDYVSKYISVGFFKLKAIGSFLLFKYLRDASQDIDFMNRCNKAIGNLIKLNYIMIDPDSDFLIYAVNDDQLFETILNYINSKVRDKASFLKVTKQISMILWSSDLSNEICNRGEHQILNQKCKSIDHRQVYQDKMNIDMGPRTADFKASIEQWWNNFEWL